METFQMVDVHQTWKHDYNYDWNIGWCDQKTLSPVHRNHVPLNMSDHTQNKT